MTSRGSAELSDEILLCYCTSLTMRELRQARETGQWPPVGKENTGKLCTGCLGDLQYCLRRLGVGEPG